jgi:hypothetical protein
MVRLAVRILRTPAETSAPGGVTANAVHVMRLATEEIEEVRTEDGKSAAAVAFGRKAGLARARTLNRESRLTIARKVPRVDGRDRSRRVCSGSRSRFARRASAYVRHDTKVQRRHVEDEAPSRAIALGVEHAPRRSACGRVRRQAAVCGIYHTLLDPVRSARFDMSRRWDTVENGPSAAITVGTRLLSVAAPREPSSGGRGCVQTGAAKIMSRRCRTIRSVGSASLNVLLWTNPCGRSPGPAHPGTLLVRYVWVTLT